ncbi:MAG: imidazolonepropionase-like amidohydrolase [Rhodothermales bacterium]|jgi:imidazolonepropionase-like amidohydrolase
MRISLLLLAFILAAAPAAAQTVVIRAGHLVDVVNGRIVDNQSILVEDGKITAVGASVRAPAGAEVIDLSDSYVMPGLIDSHTHLALMEMDGSDIDDHGSYYYASLIEDTPMRVAQGTMMVRAMLEAGFVWVRDTGNNGLYGDVTLRRAIQGGWIPGPNMVTAGRMIAPFGGQFQMNPEKPALGEPEYFYADSHEEIIRAVRENVHYGATFIKLIIDNQPYYYSVEDVQVAVKEAHAMGVKVMAHAGTPEGIQIAVDGGVDSIEHGWAPTEESWAEMVKRGTYLVGTDFPASRLGEARYQANIKRNQRAYELGVNMAFGSDMVYYEEGKTRGEQTISFLDSYIDAGLPNAHILRMATMNGADLLGANSGRTEVGYNADIIAMAENPLADIHALYGVAFVMKDGVVYKRDGQFRFDIPTKLNNPRRKQPRGNMLLQNR